MMFLAVLVSGSLFQLSGPYEAKDCYAMKEELRERKAICLLAEQRISAAPMPYMNILPSYRIELPK